MSDRPITERPADVPATARTGQVPATRGPLAMRPDIGGPAVVPPARVGAGRRAALALIALASILIGAWSAIVAYAGPSFGYALDSGPSWSWNGHRLLLHLAPGAVAVVAGVAVAMVAASWRRNGGSAGSGMLTIAGFLLAACGAWLVLGEDVWSALRSPLPTYYDAPSQWIHFTRVVGIQLGPGLVLAVMGGLSVGLARLGPARPVDAREPAADLVGTPAVRDRTGSAVR